MLKYDYILGKLRTVDVSLSPGGGETPDPNLSNTVNNLLQLKFVKEYFRSGESIEDYYTTHRFVNGSLNIYINGLRTKVIETSERTFKIPLLPQDNDYIFTACYIKKDVTVAGNTNPNLNNEVNELLRVKLFKEELNSVSNLATYYTLYPFIANSLNIYINGQLQKVEEQGNQSFKIPLLPQDNNYLLTVSYIREDISTTGDDLNGIVSEFLRTRIFKEDCISEINTENYNTVYPFIAGTLEVSINGLLTKVNEMGESSFKIPLLPQDKNHILIIKYIKK